MTQHACAYHLPSDSSDECVSSNCFLAAAELHVAVSHTIVACQCVACHHESWMPRPTTDAMTELDALMADEHLSQESTEALLLKISRVSHRIRTLR